MQMPPTQLARSTIATRLPSLAPWIAAFCPAGPEPITAISYCLFTGPFSLRLKQAALYQFFAAPTNSRLREKRDWPPYNDQTNVFLLLVKPCKVNMKLSLIL